MFDRRWRWSLTRSIPDPDCDLRTMPPHLEFRMPSLADRLTPSCPFVRIGIPAGALPALPTPSALPPALAKNAIPVFTPASNSAWHANFWDYILPPPQG